MVSEKQIKLEPASIQNSLHVCKLAVYDLKDQI